MKSEKKGGSKARAKSGDTSTGFTAEERAAVRDYLKEKRAAAKKGGAEVDGDAEVRAKLAEMSASDRRLGERIHALITENAPTLVPRLWYGMPAYSKDGDVLCWYQPAGKFKARYSFLGFSDGAQLDEGRMWPISYALTDLTPTEEAAIVALVKRAVG